MHINYYQITGLFGLSEILLLLARRSKSAGVKNRSDKNSLGLLWIVIIGCLIFGGMTSTYEKWVFPHQAFAMYAGLVILAIGFIIRWTAIIQLGKRFTVDVSISNAHTLKTSGLYKIVRHPSYLGLMLIFFGIALFLGNLLSFIIIVVPTFLALNYRIKIEEKALTDEFGEQYIAYKRKVARIIPGLY
ncbi:MAG: isoprenylcysteine carboxylmethyltransferase family protein [Mucilaginibacter sp.]